MNKLIISMLAVIVLLGSCSKDDDEVTLGDLFSEESN